MDMKSLRDMLTAVNHFIADMKCSNPEHQKQIEELQAAMQHVKDLADRMQE